MKPDRASLSRQYVAAFKARRWKRANEIYQELKALTNAELRRTIRQMRKAA